MALALSSVIVLCILVFGCVAVAVVAFGVHDMLYAPSRVIRIDIQDPWTRLLDDAIRRQPKMPRLKEAVRELRVEYFDLLKQRRELMVAMSAHERVPGDNTQADFLQRQLDAREAQIGRVRLRVRELHALVVVRQLAAATPSLLVSEGVVERMRADGEVDRLAAIRAANRAVSAI